MAAAIQQQLRRRRKIDSRELFPIALFAILCIGSFYSMTQFTHGKYIYPLDDTYIGMATAKNFALHGVWGVTRHEFTSAVSSPLFILLLAGCYKVTGPTEWWPLVLSSLFSLISLLIAHRVLRNTSFAVRSGATAGLALLVPMNVIASLGMEHSLHIALSLLFLHEAAKLIAGDQKLGWKLPAIAAAMVGARYEGLFAVGVVSALLLLWKRRPLESALVSLAGAAPAAAYGFVSASHGWYWLPDSLLMKGSDWDYKDPLTAFAMIFRVFAQLARAPWLICPLLALAVGIIAFKRSERLYPLAAAAIAFSTGIVHLVYARIGWVYRYEAYIIAMAIVALALIAEQATLRRRILFGGLIAAAIFGLAVRTIWAMGSLPIWSAAIYSQQYQMAQFLSRYYPHASVAANDIGAINYLSDLRCLDLSGLANVDVLRAKREKKYGTAVIEDEARKFDPEIAIVFDAWFSERPLSEFGGPPLPHNWIPVERWKVPDFNLLGSDTITFYAIRPGAEAQLRQDLEAFSPRLPEMVTVLPQ